MKVVILGHARNSPTDHVLKSISGVDRQYKDEGPWEGLEDYDLIHLAWPGLYDVSVAPAPVTGNIWNVPLRRMDAFGATCKLYEATIVDDRMSYNLLKQLGVENIHLVPMAVDSSGFQPLPLPKTFTVGIFGNNYDSKRFNTVIQACKWAEVECFAQIQEESRTAYTLDPVRDYYQHVSVHVQSSYSDTNSLTSMEALWCGRGVVVSPACIEHERWGRGRVTLYDGTPEDLAEKLKALKVEYEGKTWWSEIGGPKTPRPEPTPEAYWKVWEEALENDL